MKQIILFILLLITTNLILITTNVLADTTKIYNGKCSELQVNISIKPYQDDNEYVLEPNCTIVFKLTDNYKIYNCLCINNKTELYLTPQINSVGNYTIKIQEYSLKDNETKSVEPIEHKNNNPTAENITSIVTLPNNITINRIIEPDQTFNYIETKEDYIIIPDSNVNFTSIDTSLENINLVLQSHGYKCFDIYSDNGVPKSISINGTSTDFTYNNTTQLIHFCTTFSTKSISISWKAISTGINSGSRQSTSTNLICTPKWNCSDWSNCIGGQQSRICTTSNNCYFNIPINIKSCNVTINKDIIINNNISNNENNIPIKIINHSEINNKEQPKINIKQEDKKTSILELILLIICLIMIIILSIKIKDYLRKKLFKK